MANKVVKKIIYFLNYLLFPLARLYCLILKPNRAGVKIIIKNNNEILLLKRTYGKKAWTLPGGGISKNETPEDAVRRELKEEVGINLINITQHGSFQHEGKDIKDLVYVFSADVQNNTLNINNYEIQEAKWFNIEELKDKIAEWQTPILKKCLESAKIL